MGPAFSRKYNTAITATTAQSIKIPMVKRGVVDFAVGADWTPATGDVKVSKDGGAAANIATLPAAVAMGNTAYWEFVFSGAELSCGTLAVTIADSATKAVEDQAFLIETFGNASALYPLDWTDVVRLGLTALPNAAASAVGGLPVAVDTSGRVDVLKINGTSQTARDIGASVLLSSGAGTGQLDFTSGVVKANLAQILATALTETSGQLAAAFKKFFNIATPAATMDHGVLVDTVTTYTGNTPQTGDAFARLGVAGVGLTNLGDTRIAHLDADVSSRLAPAGTLATVTNLTNAPTAGDFTATMKTSLNSATPAVTVSDKTGFSLLAGQLSVKKNTALSAFGFILLQTDGLTPATGVTVTAQRSIDGAALGACANSVTELGSGIYLINLAAADLNGTTIMLSFSGTGAMTTFIELITQA